MCGEFGGMSKQGVLGKTSAWTRSNFSIIRREKRRTMNQEVSMARMPSNVAEFLAGKRFAVAGVSRSPTQAANAVFRKLRGSGFEVFPVNPNTNEVESAPCYPDLGSIPGPIDGVVIATHPDVSVELVRQCAALGISQVWLHRSFGQGSVSPEAIHECRVRGIRCIQGGCPLMYCEPVDLGHRCIRWWLRLGGQVPG
jgi:predicted CoA-binding protein